MKIATAGRAKSREKSSSPQAAVRLTSKFHLTMANLIEAEAEESPDEAKIKQLTKSVEKLRKKLGPIGDAGPGQGRGRGQGRGAGHDQG